MAGMKTALFAGLAIAALVFITAWVRAWRRDPADARRPPSARELLVGFVTNFFDTLGIGSFAPTTALAQASPRCVGW